MSRSLSHQVGILTLGRVITYAIMFVVPLVNVRTLSVEQYGYYKQFWLIFETLTPILLLGFSRSLLYYLPRTERREERSAYLTQTVLYFLLASLLATLIYAVMAHTLGAGLGAAARGFYWRLSFFTLCMMVTDYMEVLFVAQRQPIAQSVYHASAWGVQALVVIAASYLSHDVSTIIWGLAAYAAVRLVFALAYTHSRYRFSPRLISLRSIREQASFAVPVGLTGIALLLLSQTDKFVINRFLGREAFAIYSVGAFQLPLANILQTSIGNVTFPLMAQYQKAENLAAMHELWRRSTLKTAILFFPVFVFMEITARPFITILFTKQYANATPVFMVYMLLFLRSFVETGVIIQAFNRTMFIFWGFVIGFAVNLVLAVLFLRWMGAAGVPMATLITLTVVNAANLWYSAKLIGSSFLQLMPVGGLVARFVAAAVPGGIIWLLYRKHPVTNVFELMASCAIYTALYALLCAVTRLVTVDDVKSLIGRRAA